MCIHSLPDRDMDENIVLQAKFDGAPWACRGLEKDPYTPAFAAFYPQGPKDIRQLMGRILHDSRYISLIG